LTPQWYTCTTIVYVHFNNL